jgi:hypothetical protein
LRISVVAIVAVLLSLGNLGSAQKYHGAKQPNPHMASLPIDGFELGRWTRGVCPRRTAQCFALFSPSISVPGRLTIDTERRKTAKAFDFKRRGKFS